MILDEVFLKQLRDIANSLFLGEGLINSHEIKKQTIIEFSKYDRRGIEYIRTLFIN